MIRRLGRVVWVLLGFYSPSRVWWVIDRENLSWLDRRELENARRAGEFGRPK